MTLTYLLWRFVLCVHLVRTSAIKGSQQLYVWLHYDRLYIWLHYDIFPTIMGGRIIILIRNICVNDKNVSFLCKTTHNSIKHTITECQTHNHRVSNTQSPSVKHAITECQTHNHRRKARGRYMGKHTLCAPQRCHYWPGFL